MYSVFLQILTKFKLSSVTLKWVKLDTNQNLNVTKTEIISNRENIKIYEFH